MTAMDKKIDELNAKLGRKTGIDFKGSAKVWGKELYADKTVLTGVATTAGLFVLTSTGVIFSVLGGIGAGYVFNKVTSKSSK